MVSPEIAIFAERVRRALGHLSVEQVADLTDGLEANVAASVADGTPLPDVDVYVAELLSAAGIDVTPEPIGPFASFRRAFEFAERIASPIVRWSRGLAPMWWVVRAFAITVVLGAWTSRDPAWGGSHTFIAVADRESIGFAVFGLLLVASVWWGRRDTVIPGLIRAVVGVVLVILAYVATNDEFRWANQFASAEARQYCYQQGYDSQGKIGLPKLPPPNMMGMHLREADAAITKWGRGLAVISGSFDPTWVGMEGVDQSVFPESVPGIEDTNAVVVEQQPPALVSGTCAYIEVPVRFEVVPPTTVLPATTTVPPTIAPSTTTSSSTTVTPPSTVLGVVTPATTDG